MNASHEQLQQIEDAAELRQLVRRLGAENEQLKQRLGEEPTGNAVEDQQAGMQLADIVSSMGDAVVAVDRSGGITYANQAASQLLGYSSMELVGQPLLNLLGRETLANDQRVVDIVRQGARVADEETVAIAKDGRELPVSLSVSPVIDKRGESVGSSVMLRDIRDRKIIEDELRTSEERFAALLKSLDDVIWFFEPGKNTFYINSAVEEIYGRTREEFRDNHELWLEVVDPRDRAIAEQSQEHLWEYGYADSEYRIRTADGRTKWLHDRKSLTFGAEGQPLSLCGIGTDVTARRVAEESLRTSNRMLAEIHDLQSKFIADAPTTALFDPLLASLLSTSQSEYGFIGEVLHRENGEPYLKTQAITNIAWNDETRSFYEKNAPDGLEFANMRTLFGNAILTGEVVIANEPAADSRSGGTPKGHPSLNAFLGIPLHSRGELIGMAGVANREGGYDQQLVDLLQPLLSVCTSLLIAYRSERERKQAKREVQESEARFRALIENSHDVILLLSAARELVYVSPSVERVLGYSPHELVGEMPSKLIHLDDVEDARRTLAECLESPGATGQFVHRLRHRDGSFRVVEATVTNLLHEPGVNAVVSIFRDVTDRIRAEEELKRSERRYRALIQSAPEAIFVFDVDEQRFVDVNHNAVLLFGYSREEFLNSHPRRISASVQPDGRTFDETFDQLAPKAIAGEQVTLEWVHRRADGVEFPSEIRLSAIPSSKGQRIRGSVVDITHRKKQEECLREQERTLAHVSRLSTLGEMVAGIAHEVNQPLSAISNYAAACKNVINSGDQPNADVVEWTAQIADQAVRCGDIIRRLRDFVKKNDEDREQFDLNEIARDSIALVNSDLRRTSVVVDCKLAEPLPLVHVNRIQIEQVIVNLLRNACEAIVRQNATDLAIVLITNALRAGVRLTIVDRGHGIKEGDVDRLFDAFFTTKADGMGMGLAISRTIIESHSGRLWVDKDRADGAAFHIELPAHPRES